MTALLASVMSAEEAELAVQAAVDIVDLKDPRFGALGALAPAEVRKAVQRVAGSRPVSATIGDLEMRPEIVAEAVQRTGALGVDFVKIGLFPGGDPEACIAALADDVAKGLRLVAVLFADRTPDFGFVECLAAHGFVGVMLDTAGKAGGGLRRHLSEADLAAFVARARGAGLFSGLAGSLALSDIPPLLGLGADYLGFRGALTAGGRDAALDPAALAAVRRAIPASSNQPFVSSAAKIASAAAGAQEAAQSTAS